MRIAKNRNPDRVEYWLSCMHNAGVLINARGCTTTCPECLVRVFILQTRIHTVIES